MHRCSKLRQFSTVTTVLLLSGGYAAAQTKSTAKLKQEAMADYRAHLGGVQALVQACAADAAGCDTAKVGVDERVVDGAQTFQVRWQWLRDDVEQARKADAKGRAQLMQTATARLDEMLRENRQAADGSAAQFATARKDADRILAGTEFAAVQPQSWLDRQIAKFWLGWERFWEGAGSLGAAAPWLGRLLEWLLFGGAAVGLLFFVQRNLQRQRLAVSLNTHAGELAWTRESTDWAAQAEASARDGDWRDAVHSLYWATIVMLEGRRAWRHNPARTPREYVRLLKPGSAQQRALRGLTQLFERLWYGLRDAGPADYERARSLYESLRDNAAAGAA
jgi:hypothetical protein